MQARITTSFAIAAALAAVSFAPSTGALAARGTPGPVCAWLPDGPTTYDSFAAAAHAHARVIHIGACNPIACWSWMGVFRSEPMCGIDPLTKVRMTYPNRCAAEHAQAIWVHDGGCERRR
jgi:hypothetical protein